LTRDAFLGAVKSGRGMATNAPLLDFTVAGARPGDTVEAPGGRHDLAFRASLRSNVPVDHLEIVWNGEVVAALSPGADGRGADASGTVATHGSGWLVLRAWSRTPSDDLLDIYPFATTSPIYVSEGGGVYRSREAATYFLRWLDRLEAATRSHPAYRTPAEREQVLRDIGRARAFYEDCAARAGGR
jgi:hypothetical protein